MVAHVEIVPVLVIQESILPVFVSPVELVPEFVVPVLFFIGDITIQPSSVVVR